MRVLIVEDERSLAIEMESFLKKAHYYCDIAFTATDALNKTSNGGYDFILLDLGLPDKDGLVFLKEFKKDHTETAVIILTARGDVEDRITGLDLGADDYLSKPFSLPELQSRMQAITRRRFKLSQTIIEIGNFRVDINNRMVYFESREVELSRREFDLLNYLLLHKNRPLTRMQLSEHLWGDNADDDYDSNYIDVHIKNIRKKMGAFSNVDWLETIRGIGYKIKKQE